MASPIIPFLRYQDVGAAVDWLVEAFGFTRFDITEVEGTVVHAELQFGDSTVQLGAAAPDGPLAMSSPRDLPATNAGVYVFLSSDPAEVDAHYKRATAAGASTIWEPHDTFYGAHDYAVFDLEGHPWSFGTYTPDLTRSDPA